MLFEPISTFCSWINRRIRRNPSFFKKDYVDRRSKIQKSRNRQPLQWSLVHENPNAVRASTFQHEFSVNVWAAIIDDKLIGPIELPSSLNGPRFLEFLQNEFFDALNEIPLIYRQNMWLQLDGAPAHFARQVRQYLNDNYSPWIGCGGTVAWPPRSSDLTPLDFFLWGHMKQSLLYGAEHKGVKRKNYVSGRRNKSKP